MAACKRYKCAEMHLCTSLLLRLRLGFACARLGILVFAQKLVDLARVGPLLAGNPLHGPDDRSCLSFTLIPGPLTLGGCWIRGREQDQLQVVQGCSKGCRYLTRIVAFNFAVGCLLRHVHGRGGHSRQRPQSK